MLFSASCFMTVNNAPPLGNPEILKFPTLKKKKTDYNCFRLVLGLHLSPAGYQLAFDELMRVIKHSCPELVPEKIPRAVTIPWELGQRWYSE